MDDAVNAGTAVRASCQAVRDAGGLLVAVAALLALGRATTVVTGTRSLPFHALASLPSQVWPADDCPLCDLRIPLGTWSRSWPRFTPRQPVRPRRKSGM